MTGSFNFEHSFRAGHACYNGKVGAWWHCRSTTNSHQYAYKTIIQYIFEFLRIQSKAPRIIVDYACGPGDMLVLLAKHFPQSSIIGLDGSKMMLKRAGALLKARNIDYAVEEPENVFECNESHVTLVQTKLPNFSLPRKKADLVLFVFPNIVPRISEQPYYDRHGYKHRKDAKMGRFLAEFKEKNPTDNVSMDPDGVLDQLMTNKVISRNIAHLLKMGGMAIRADYAGAERKQLTKGALLRTDFEQGVLTKAVNGYESERIFRLLHSTYRRSNVIVDVFHQTKNDDDRKGGYLISGMQCIV